MKQYAAVGRSQRFAQSYFVGSFADRHEHDVDNADRAQSQRYHSNRPQEHVHYIENSIYHFRLLNGVPAVKGVLIGRIESMIARYNLMNILLRKGVLCRDVWLIFNKRNRVLVVFALNRERRRHHLKRNVATHV